MSLKRERIETYINLNDDDDDHGDDDEEDGAFDDGNDIEIMNDIDTAFGNDAAPSSPGIVWLPEQQTKSYNVGDGRGNRSNQNTFSNSRDFVRDENIITKYFTVAVQSHYKDGPISTKSDTTVMPQEHVPNDSYPLQLWEPKEIELPLWAVIASQP